MALSHDGIRSPRLLGKADHSSVSRGGLYVTKNRALGFGALVGVDARTGEPQGDQRGKGERLSPAFIAASVVPSTTGRGRSDKLGP